MMVNAVTNKTAAQGLGPDSAAPGSMVEPLVLAGARALARSGKLRQAAQMLLPVLSNGTGSAEAFDLMARILAQTGDLKAARGAWESALRIDPSNQEYQRALLRCENGRSVSPAWQLGWIGAVVLVCALAVMVVARPHTAGEPRRHPQSLAQTGSKQATDALRTSVRGLLAANPETAALGLKVEQSGAGVMISGRVPDLRAKYLVERVAQSARGLKMLDTRGVSITGLYTVRRGDSLWSLAQRTYGTPHAWPRIAVANHMRAPYALEIGSRIEVPPTIDTP